MVTYILIIVGAVFALIGIILFIKGIGAKTASKIKFLALEFESKGSSLIIFLVGAALIALGASRGENNNTDKTGDLAGGNQTVSSNTAESTPASSRSLTDNAASLIDKAIQDITAESINWRTILQRVAGELSQDLSVTIRNDVQDLANRSVATTGVEFGCNTDVLAKNAIASLRLLKTKLIGENTVAPPRPAFCQVIPGAINLNRIQGSIPRVTIQGYDMDYTDASGKKIVFYLQKANGDKEKITEERVSRSTHYQVTLNLDDMHKRFYTDRIVKIISTWNDSQEACPEVNIIPWAAQQDSETKNLGMTSFTPPKIGRGDPDFNTHHDEHMSVEVRGEIMLTDPGTLKYRLYMRAREERSDWTEVGGYSEWYTAYTAPAGWKISSFRPNSNSTHRGSITTHGVQTYFRPAGEIVQKFVVWGDRDGNEAGTWTRMDVYWKTIEVQIEQLVPSWAQ